MEEIEQTSIWQKKQADLTVNDQLKVALVATAAVAAVYVVIWGGIVGGVMAWEKRQARKAEKDLKKEMENN